MLKKSLLILSSALLLCACNSGSTEFVEITKEEFIANEQNLVTSDFTKASETYTYKMTSKVNGKDATPPVDTSGTITFELINSEWQVTTLGVDEQIAETALGSLCSTYQSLVAELKTEAEVGDGYKFYKKGEDTKVVIDQTIQAAGTTVKGIMVWDKYGNVTSSDASTKIAMTTEIQGQSMSMDIEMAFTGTITYSK